HRIDTRLFIGMRKGNRCSFPNNASITKFPMQPDSRNISFRIKMDRFPRTNMLPILVEMDGINGIYADIQKCGVRTNALYLPDKPYLIAPRALISMLGTMYPGTVLISERPLKMIK